MNLTTLPKTWTKTAERPLRSTGSALGVWLFSRVLGVPVPWAAIHQTDGARLLAYEYQRLVALAAAGAPVPPVLSLDRRQLATGDVRPLPLQTVKLYDALQLVLSLARFLEPLGPTAVFEVLQAYRHGAASGPDLVAFVRRLLPRLRWLLRTASWSTRLDSSREVTRLRILLAGMQRFVEPAQVR